MRDKTSYGIICCRRTPRGSEMILVCKRYTYAYGGFVHGKYDSGADGELISMFSQMTIDEKHDIMSLNFGQIWYRMWQREIPRGSNYYMARNKFENAFVATDGGQRLRRLLGRATNARPIWEVPKGRKKNKTETDLQCAIREFTEETGVAKRDYKLFPQARYSYSFIDEGVKYTNIYFFALARRDFEPRINFQSTEQVCEVADIKWMGILGIRAVDTKQRLEHLARRSFNYIKKNG
jgi:8-oxo-dGTP pyrophosphatase MutT (NUDIX family)